MIGDDDAAASRPTAGNEARAIYRSLLGREPENEHVLSLLRQLGTTERMVSAVAASSEHMSNVVHAPEAGDAVAVRAFVDNAVDEQIGPWRRRTLSRCSTLEAMRRMNAEEFWICIYEVRGNNVRIIEKPPGLMEVRPPNFLRAYQERAHNFRNLLEDTAAAFSLPENLTLAIYLGDEGADCAEFPLFSFQKNLGGLNLLLPDFEIVGMEYMAAAPADPRNYSEKEPRAVFAGSTTGGGAVVGIEQVRDHSRFPRLRAARYFRESAEVDFRLASLVQCTPESEAALRAEGFGHSPMYWPESFDNKFIISIDGNGATCSRPAIILKSNSVLMRYRSEYTLYWINALVPWLHYIPIEKDEDVIAAVHAEASNPGKFAYIATEGRRFAERFLSRPSMLRYTAAVLITYHKLLA